MSKHTHEPWEAEYRGCSSRDGENACAIVTDANGSTLFDTLNSDVQTIEREDDEYGPNYREVQGFADLSRAVACVNAMAGIADPAAFVAAAKADERPRLDSEADAASNADDLGDPVAELHACALRMVALVRYAESTRREDGIRESVGGGAWMHIREEAENLFKFNALAAARKPAPRPAAASPGLREAVERVEGQLRSRYVGMHAQGYWLEEMERWADELKAALAAEPSPASPGLVAAAETLLEVLDGYGSPLDDDERLSQADANLRAALAAEATP